MMEEILHQLRLVVYPIIYRVLYIPGPSSGVLYGYQDSHVCWILNTLYNGIIKNIYRIYPHCGPKCKKILVDGNSE